MHTEATSRAAGVDDESRYAVQLGNLAEDAIDGHFSISIECPTDFANDYVLMPAAIYGRNPFQVSPVGYTERPESVGDWGKHAPPIQRDLPRMDAENLMVEQLSGDLAFPCVAVWQRKQGRATILIGPTESPWGPTGFTCDAELGVLRIDLPGVRQRIFRKCRWERTANPEVIVIPGNSRFDTEVRVIRFACDSVHDLFERLFQVQDDFIRRIQPPIGLPWSRARSLIHDKTDRWNWVPVPGYYAVGLQEQAGQNWQTGWTGGGINSLPLLTTGDPRSVERVFATLDFATTEGQGSSGFFKSIYHEGSWRSDDARDRNSRCHLVRRSADLLYFIAKHIDVLRAVRHPRSPIPAAWLDAMRRAADAFASLWDLEHEFGQYVDWESGTLLRGGTASGAMAPGALACAARILADPRYLTVAKAAARRYAEHELESGLLNGGPGDALQAVDSESAFALLESFVVLYEETSDVDWLDFARKTAWQCASWISAFDYTFPADSTFGRLGIKSAGCVFANVQNKHGSPGICTLSGDSLFKLARATGDFRFLDLLRITARNITQYVSRPDRPIGRQPMPSGFVNERVNTSDWNEPVGEIFFGSTWAETACTLTSTELPGIYVRPDLGRSWMLDHFELTNTHFESADVVQLVLGNPTSHDADLRIVVENAEDSRTAWGTVGILRHPVVEIARGTSRKVRIERHGPQNWLITDISLPVAGFR